MRADLKIAIGIATAGRKEILTESLRELAKQTRLPDKVFICPITTADFDETSALDLPFSVLVVTGPRGLPAQRNAILRAARDYTILVFIDDDFFCLPSYLAELERCFLARSDIVAITGRVIADGVTGSGMDVTSARAALAAFTPPGDSPLIEIYNLYGCNMALRLSAVYANGVNFDEDLPLYGWLEDVDFSRQLAPFGKIIRNQRMIGVHLGSKGGRGSGIRTGYSQIANPLYLWRKGTLRLDRALVQICRNILANYAKLLRPEPWVDRRGRALGNALGFRDLIRGRLHPKGILDLS
jgi:GT2 family glycosyltransferase